MLNPTRILALGVFLVFGAAIAGQYAQFLEPSASRDAPPSLLPAAHAAPADIAFADTLRRGETLSQLLVRADLAEAEASALLAALTDHQDPRRLRPGSIMSYRKSFVGGDVRALELRLDADRTLNVRRAEDGGAWEGVVEEVPVYADTAVLDGVVESSLYAALLGDGESAVPAAERERIVDIIADRIFAWQIDFARDTRVGDRFRILYERMVRPDGTARSGRVLGAQFSIDGRDYDAYFFQSPDGEEDYYSADGESVRRAFLRAPLEFRRISSVFTTNRLHPVTGQRRAHRGVDYAARTGTPVRAVADGVVTRAGWGGGYGNVVDLRHSRGYATRYAHLNGFAKAARAGARVKQGDVIGYVGTTGLSTGPHLHYEFHANGRAVDPNSVKHLTGDPVPDQHRSEFATLVDDRVAAIAAGPGG